MSKKYSELNERLIEFIKAQHVFFVATACADGRINLSPKGGDTLRVLSNNEVIWLNLTGSGNETSAHVQEDGRMTIMFCAFEGTPLILRLYGTAEVFHPRDEGFNKYIDEFPELPGSRQIFKLTIDLVQTSCGMSVPLMDFVEDREKLNSWAEKQGGKGIEKYWSDKNQSSIDGKPTNIL